ncbi:MAG: twin-arginine translocase TatA/TatE family subunit [Schleiferiaceae bacterium]|jgi:sec-independent protein translocase protein TatA|nr:twin-arginine translocase TatA/TatE family subunit [Schleiferiaceae bacterium]
MITEHYLLFNIGGLELGLIVLVFIMLFGADKIPEIARGIGKGMKQIKHATDDIKREINESADGNQDLSDLRKGVKEAKDTFEDIQGTIKRKTKL